MSEKPKKSARFELSPEKAQAIMEKAAEDFRRKYPPKDAVSDPGEPLPLSDEEAQTVRQQFSEKPESMTEKPVVTIDAVVQETSVPTEDDSHLSANEKPPIKGENEGVKSFRRSQRKKGKPKDQEGGSVVPENMVSPRGESEPEKPPEELEAKEIESAELVELVKSQEPDSESGFAQGGKREGWLAIRETVTEKNEKESVSPVDDRLRKAQEEVAEARRQFIKEDFNKTSSWNKVKSFFRLKSEDSALGANSDVESYQDIYKEKLLLFQDLQFQAIKESGVTGEAMKEAFALTLRYFKYDEAVELYRARTDVRRENKQWGDRVAGVFENIGKEYNKLSLTKKLALSAGLIGASFATGGASLLAKRLLSGAGTFVSAEGLLEKLAEKKESSQAHKEIDQQMRDGRLHLSIMTGDREDLESRLQQIIREDINALDSKLQKKKRDMLLRKGAALGIGVGIGSGAFSQLVMEHLGGKEALQAAGTYVMENLGGQEALQAAGAYVEEVMDNVVDGEAPEAVPAPAGSMEFTDNAPIPEEPTLDDSSQPALGADVQNGIGAREVPDHPVPTEQENLIADIKKALATESGSDASSPATIEYTPEATEELAHEVLLEDGGRNFLQDYNLTRADGPRGLWGVLESRLPEGLSEAQQNTMVQKLENIIAERLAEMTPEQQGEVGFRSGDINRIYAGETIRFSELLTAEDIQKVVGGEVLPEGEVIIAPDVPETPGSIEGDAADSVPESDTLNLREPNGDVSGNSPEEIYNDNPATADIQYERDIVLGKEYNLQSYKEYFKLHEDALPLFRESGIEYMNFISQDNPALMRSIGDKTFATLNMAMINGTGLGKFVRLAGQTYGNKLGLPDPEEKVYAYVMRMAMLSVEHPTGKRIFLPKLFSI